MPTVDPSQSSGTGKTLAIVAGGVAAVLAVAALVFVLTRNDTDVANDISPQATIIATDVPDAETSDDEPAPITAATEPGDESDTTADSSDAADNATPDDSESADTTPDGTTATTEITATTAPVDASDDDRRDEISRLLAWTSFSETPLDPDAEQIEIARLIADPAVEAVASTGTVSTLCAGLPVDADFDLTITWQYRGVTVQSDAASATPPGVGSCLSNDGAPLDAGSYQVLATNADESDNGFATTFVVGAASVTQLFVNNSDVDICEVAIAPLDTAFYELFQPEDGPLRPGELLVIDVADVDQEVRTGLCSGTDLEPFTFDPSDAREQDLAP